MATITEDYVSFETAKLLKEKGFNEGCRSHYGTAGSFSYEKYEVESSECEMHNAILAPTLQMTMKWLRKVHKISIEIVSNGYLIDNDVYWECDIKAGHRLYFKHITNEKSFESCAEAAIKYCLKNLI